MGRRVRPQIVALCGQKSLDRWQRENRQADLVRRVDEAECVPFEFGNPTAARCHDHGPEGAVEMLTALACEPQSPPHTPVDLPPVETFVTPLATARFVAGGEDRCGWRSPRSQVSRYGLATCVAPAMPGLRRAHQCERSPNQEWRRVRSRSQ